MPPDKPFIHLNDALMNLLRIFFLPGLMLFLQLPVSAQPGSIVGTWQLVKEGNCLEETASNKDVGETLRKEMKSRSSAAPLVVNFKDNATGDESSRILNTSKAASQKKFLYKFNGEMLLILDKKSQTISDSYMVDKFTADSLIVSNSSRPCDTKIFLKISQDPAN
jgi:hypothetical protein